MKLSQFRGYLYKKTCVTPDMDLVRSKDIRWKAMTIELTKNLRRKRKRFMYLLKRVMQ